MSNTGSVPELPLFSSKFLWDVERPEADLDLWLTEHDDCPDATEATDCGVDLPKSADNRGTNPVDVGGDTGGDGVNGLWVNGTSNWKDCNKSFDFFRLCSAKMTV